jgi:hypothetical protein
VSSPSLPTDLVDQAGRLGWAAGFLDGEGCIHIAKQRRKGTWSDTYRLGVHIAQNDIATLEHFREVVGIEAPIYATSRASNHKRQCFTLNYSGHAAIALLNKLVPFLCRKRVEAEAARSFWAADSAVKRRSRRVDGHTTEMRRYFFDLLKQLK